MTDGLVLYETLMRMKSFVDSSWNMKGTNTLQSAQGDVKANALALN